MLILARYSARAALNILILLAIMTAIVAASALLWPASTVGWLVYCWRVSEEV